MNNDQQIEAAIRAAGANVAPRVTSEQIDALMQRVTFTGEVAPGTTSTFVHAFLDGEFYLASGHSACVSKENFKSEIGIEIAKGHAQQNARDELWKLEGYALLKQLQAAQAPQPPVDNAFVAPGCEPFTGVAAGLMPHQQRVVDEKTELDGRLAKLTSFIGTATFERLDNAEQDRLRSQEGVMLSYSAILGARIAAF